VRGYLQPQLGGMKQGFTSCVMSIPESSGLTLGVIANGRTFELTCARGS